MARKGLSIAEALKVLEELPSVCTDRSSKTEKYDFDELSDTTDIDEILISCLKQICMPHKLENPFLL